MRSSHDKLSIHDAESWWPCPKQTGSMGNIFPDVGAKLLGSQGIELQENCRQGLRRFLCIPRFL